MGFLGIPIALLIDRTMIGRTFEDVDVRDPLLHPPEPK
jgi:hypothetical protein